MIDDAGICARVKSTDVNRRRRNVRVLRDGRVHARDCPDDAYDDRDNDGENRSVNEKLCHELNTSLQRKIFDMRQELVYFAAFC